jgi:hypothetical protein
MKNRNLIQFSVSSSHTDSVTKKVIDLYNLSLPLHYYNYQRKIKAYGKLNNYNCTTIYNACQLAQSNYVFQTLPIGTDFKVVFMELERENNKISLVLNVLLDYDNLKNTKHVVVTDTSNQKQDSLYGDCQLYNQYNQDYNRY